jgi:Xaa-Pro aminopeptidase
VGGYFTLEQGMTIVIEPNVVKPYESAGVQTGELVAVTPPGPSAFTTAHVG